MHMHTCACAHTQTHMNSWSLKWQKLLSRRTEDKVEKLKKKKEQKGKMKTRREPVEDQFGKFNTGIIEAQIEQRKWRKRKHNRGNSRKYPTVKRCKFSD